MRFHSVKPFVTRCVGDPNFSNALAIETLSLSQNPNGDKQKHLVADLLPLVQDAAVAQFQLQKYSSASKTLSSRNDYPYSSWPKYGDVKKGRLDASNIVKLYQQLLQSDTTKASELLDKIQSQTESLPEEELNRLVIPLLEKLLHIVDLSSPDARQFFQSMTQTYVTRVVQKEPEKPRDWSRPKEKEKCWLNCLDCQNIKKFLLDPQQEHGRFVILSDNRYHIQNSVSNNCECSTNISANPPEVIIRKTLKGWEKVHEKWQERASRAQKILKGLPQKELKQSLADEYDAIMGLSIVRLQEKESSSQATKDVEKRSRGGSMSEEVPSKRQRM
jgi:hypothetical protein